MAPTRENTHEPWERAADESLRIRCVEGVAAVTTASPSNSTRSLREIVVPSKSAYRYIDDWFVETVASAIGTTAVRERMARVERARVGAVERCGGDAAHVERAAIARCRIVLGRVKAAYQRRFIANWY
eukprot:662831-Pleurochrysis_carterae.AAC.1